jgi:glycosyltransferase involved in cell wall biosynthesis
VLLGDGELRRRMSEAARRRAVAFSVDTMGQRVKHVYDAVVKGRTAHRPGSYSE